MPEAHGQNSRTRRSTRRAPPLFDPRNRARSFSLRTQPARCAARPAPAVHTGHQGALGRDGQPALGHFPGLPGAPWAAHHPHPAPARPGARGAAGAGSRWVQCRASRRGQQGGASRRGQSPVQYGAPGDRSSAATLYSAAPNSEHARHRPLQRLHTPGRPRTPRELTPSLPCVLTRLLPACLSALRRRPWLRMPSWTRCWRRRRTRGATYSGRTCVLPRSSPMISCHTGRRWVGAEALGGWAGVQVGGRGLTSPGGHVAF